MTTEAGGGRRPRILVLEALHGSTDCVREAGATALTQSPRDLSGATEAIDTWQWDGLLLTGGSDVDPRMYGQKPHRRVYGVNETRDLVEVYALEAARERGVPVLGICRGAQIMSVEAGGVLKQHIEGHRGGKHPVITAAESKLRTVAGETPRCVSLHHQHVRVAPDGWRVTAHAPDGVPEAVESDDGRCMGVQFHPEMDPGADCSRGIFRWLVEEAASRAGLELPAPQRVERAPDYEWRRPSRPTQRGRLPKPRRARQQTQIADIDRMVEKGQLVRLWQCHECPERFETIQGRARHMHDAHGHAYLPR